MKNVVLISFIVIFFSCGTPKEREVEHISIAPAKLIHDLEVTMPGNFYVMDSLVFVEIVRSSSEQVHVYSLNSNQLKAKICNNGRAENELIQACLVPLSDSVIVVTDINGKGIYYSVENLSVIEVRNDLGHNFDTQCRITPNSYVEVNSSRENKEWFIYNINGEEHKFGVFPLEKDYKDWSILVRGTMHYDKKNSMLYFFSSMLPYVAKYKFNNNSFTLENEKYYGKYTITKSEKGFSKIERDNFDFSNLIFTENYIVNLTKVPREENSATSNAGGMNFLPKHLYLYDYDYNLVKIVDMGAKVLRLSSGGLDSDIVYLISVEDGLYNISKVVL